jgi:7-cyano-7-deazaguanine synthase
MPSAILLSGGLDSAVLLAEEAAAGDVQPVYVSAGLAWEPAERAMVSRLLLTPPFAGIGRPLVTLTVDMRDTYAASHWAVAGRAPAYDTPDEDVYLAGRNLVLLAKAGVHCALAGLDRIVLGTLDGNPFPDATPAFRAAMAQAAALALARPMAIDAPYADQTKAGVIRRGLALGVPLALTLSCMQPVWRSDDAPLPRHCGRCSKCRERHDAFLRVNGSDPTDYVDRAFVGDASRRSAAH